MPYICIYTLACPVSACKLFLTAQCDLVVPISLAFLPPNLTNMNKITYRQAAIDSSMPGEFKKCN